MILYSEAVTSKWNVDNMQMKRTNRCMYLWLLEIYAVQRPAVLAEAEEGPGSQAWAVRKLDGAKVRTKLWNNLRRYINDNTHKISEGIWKKTFTTDILFLFNDVSFFF